MEDPITFSDWNLPLSNQLKLTINKRLEGGYLTTFQPCHFITHKNENSRPRQLRFFHLQPSVHS